MFFSQFTLFYNTKPDSHKNHYYMILFSSRTKKHVSNFSSTNPNVISTTLKRRDHNLGLYPNPKTPFLACTQSFLDDAGANCRFQHSLKRSDNHGVRRYSRRSSSSPWRKAAVASPLLMAQLYSEGREKLQWASWLPTCRRPRGPGVHSPPPRALPRLGP